MSVPSSSWTIISTTVEESSSVVAGAPSSRRDSPSAEVSALSTSPTGSSGAGSLAAASSAPDCADCAASASEPAWWRSDPGMARDVGSAMATAHAPAIAKSFTGFFGVMCLTPMMCRETRTGLPQTLTEWPLDIRVQHLSRNPEALWQNPKTFSTMKPGFDYLTQDTIKPRICRIFSPETTSPRHPKGRRCRPAHYHLHIGQHHPVRLSRPCYMEGC